MNDVQKIYSNEIGISFRWNHVNTDLTQIIFRDTGFHLSEKEIEIFINKLDDAKKIKQCQVCQEKNCKSILLQTPSNKVSLAISKTELGQIEDLLKGTLFQIRLNNYVREICDI